MKKEKTYFVEGCIPADFVAEEIRKHSHKKGIGAHAFFLGQVRADLIDGKEVKEIEYSAYKEMADPEFSRIREDAFAKYSLSCLHIYHSLGPVKAGEISLFVMVSGKHRKDCFTSLEEIVDEIKLKVPVWKKEIFEDGNIHWV
jgi:molybdopterin synthase catalytic subunit